MHFRKLVLLGLFSSVLVTNSVGLINAEDVPVYESGTQVNDCLAFLQMKSDSDKLSELNTDGVKCDIKVPENIGTPNVNEFCKIYEKASETSNAIAKLKKFGIVEILDDEEYEGFVKVKIGEIMGYINKKFIYTGKKAEEFIKDNIKEYKQGVVLKEGLFAVAGYKSKKLAESEVEDFKTDVKVDKDDTVYKTKSASSVVKNEFEFKRIAKLTTKEDDYVYKNKSLDSVRLGMYENGEELEVLKYGDKFTKVITSRGVKGYVETNGLEFSNKKVEVSNIVGTLHQGDKVTIKQEGLTWCKTDKGYIKREDVSITHSVDEKSKSEFIMNYGEVINIEDEDSKYIKTENGYINKNFLTKSVVTDLDKLELLKDGSQLKLDKNINYNVGGEAKGKEKEVIEYALKFLGNPYVWGGNSLTNGVDCSGYVREIYRKFGYSLPRVACDQANTYKSIKIEDVKPADLVFYSNGYNISHVAMYIGNNKVIHASNHIDGIKISEWTYRKPVKVIRLLKEEEGNKDGEKKTSKGSN